MNTLTIIILILLLLSISLNIIFYKKLHKAIEDLDNKKNDNTQIWGEFKQK
jgi:septation ring formation regulator EzrA